MKRLVFCLLLACSTEAKAPASPAHDDALCGESFPEYKPGMSVMVGALHVKLRNAKPTPPRQKIPNQWELEITDQGGNALSDVTLSNPDSYMPAHNHHGRTRPSVAGMQVQDIEFNMRGPWQVLVDLEQSGTKLGTATFQVCVR